MSYLLGLDRSGNNNNFTVNNMTLADQMLDTPTNNFATINPLSKMNNGTVTLSEGNLKFSLADNAMARSSIMPSSGKWYWEAFLQFTDGANLANIGLSQTGYISGAPFDSGAAVEGYIYISNGSTRSHRTSGDQSYAGNTYAVNDIIGVAYDADNGTLAFYKNNVAQGTAYSSLSGQLGAFFSGYGNTARWIANFGQDSSFAAEKTAQGNQDGNDIGDFYYTPPNGFLALCSKSLPTPDVIPSEHFNTVLYTGTDDTGSGHSITGVGFEPSFVWTKDRDATYGHYLFDAVRGTGVTKGLRSNTTADEGMANESYDALSSFDSDGFTITGSAFGSLYQDRGSANYVAWNWKANGSGSSNTNGSINSTVSANVDAGFSIVSYTGAGSAATIGHGLSQAPEMYIVKDRDTGLTNWWTYHIGNTSAPETDAVRLNGNNVTTDDSTLFNDTAPTALVFSVGSYSEVSGNTKKYISYCFHSVDGYSKVGSYTGNSSADGPFVYTGFRPAFILMKNASRAGSWYLVDTKQDSGFNSMNNTYSKHLLADTSGAQDNPSGVDFLSNGFKLRTPGTGQNYNTDTIIYIAFAESPFKYSNAR